MKIIERELNIDENNLKLLSKYLTTDSYAVFDIETTGLSPAFSSLILSGFILIKNEHTKLIQYFAETPDQESDVLDATYKLLSDVSFVVTYNGRYFDIPFFKKRCERYGYEYGHRYGIDAREPFNLDLYVLMKYYSPIGKILPSLSQKSLEKYSGIFHLREDKIGGEESVIMYDTYQRSRSKDLENKILLHNSDDVTQLYRLMYLLKNCDLDRAFFKSGFPIEGGLITGVALKGQDLLIRGFSDTPAEYISFPSSESPLLVHSHKNDGAFEIRVPCEKRDKAIYVDLLPFASMNDLSDVNRNTNVNCGFESLSELGGYVNDYLILKDENTLKYEEMNTLAKFITEKVLRKISGN